MLETNEDTAQEGQEEEAETNEELETSNNEEQPQANPEEGDASESPQAGEDTLIDIDGEKYTPQQIKEGMMRQEDYTRKTQEVADMRRQYEQHGTNALENQEDPYAGYSPEQKQAMELIDNRIKDQVQEAMKPLENQLSDKEVKQEINDVMKKYKLDDNKVQEALKMADEMGANQLEPVVKAMLYDNKLQEVKQETEQSTKKNLQKRKAAISESPSGQGKVSKGRYDVKGKDWDDVLEDAKRDLTSMEG